MRIEELSIDEDELGHGHFLFIREREHSCGVHLCERLHHGGQAEEDFEQWLDRIEGLLELAARESAWVYLSL